MEIINGVPNESLPKIEMARAPLTTDIGYSVPTLWLDTTGDTAYVLVDVTGSTATWTAIAGGVSNMAAITDPAGTPTFAAVTTAIVNAYGGIVITLTGAGNAQTIQSPTVTTARKTFIVVNNDTSGANTITINGITLAAGKAQSFIWDGSAWGPMDIGITAIPVTVVQGGTGLATVTDHGIMLGSGTGAVTPMAVLDTGQMVVGVSGADPATVAANITTTKKFLTETGTGTVGATPVFDTIISGDLTTALATSPKIIMAEAMNTAYATVASHATTSAIWAAAGNVLNFTGTETITDFPAAPQAGAQRTLICAGACVFTHAGALTVQGGATRTAVVGDVVTVTAITTSTFRVNFIAQTETGTGSTVRATSPTLVTPILGVAAATSIQWAKPSNIADSATPAIGGAAGNVVDLDGTTTITGFDTVAAGVTRFVSFTGIRTLTYNVTSLILPGVANILTAVGDRATFISLGSGNWRCHEYLKASGFAIGRNNEVTMITDSTIARDVLFGGQINNYNQSADATLTIPAIEKGMNFCVVLSTTVAKYFRLDPNASDTIYLDGVADSDGHYVGVASAAAGNALQFTAFQTGASAYDLAVITVSGSWLME